MYWNRMQIIAVALLPFFGACLNVKTAFGQGAAAREASEVILQSLTKYFGRSSAKEAAEELAEIGGETAVRQITQKAMREGGEETVEQIAKVTSKYGPNSLKALKQADKMGPVVRSLDELPEESVKVALQRLASTSGRELSENIATYGTKALQAELKHPGIGTTLVRTLGDDGIELTSKLTREEALQLAKHADDIAKLPAAEKSGVLKLLHDDAKSMVQFMGRFIEKNPGKTLFAAGTTTVILAQPERILGGDEIVFDKDGVPHLMSKPGIAGRIGEGATNTIIKPLMTYVIPIAAAGFAIWIAMKLAFAYQKGAAKARRSK